MNCISKFKLAKFTVVTVLTVWVTVSQAALLTLVPWLSKPKILYLLLHLLGIDEKHNVANIFVDNTTVNVANVNGPLESVLFFTLKACFHRQNYFIVILQKCRRSNIAILNLTPWVPLQPEGLFLFIIKLSKESRYVE